jgi:hypothetical protein
MLPRSGAHAVGAAPRAAPPATTIASLPHALLARVLARLPVDARLRCSEVCRGWRHMLATERVLWTALDLSPSSGVACRVTDALLRTATSKAGGTLTTLDVCGFNDISHEALLAVVTANAASVLELRMSGTFHAESCAQAEALLRAAPRLRVLVEDMQCGDVGQATHLLLHNAGVFQRLCLRALDVNAEGADGTALRAFAAALAAFASPLVFLHLADAPLGALDVLDAVVDAALTNRLASVQFSECGLSPASAPSLARLLGGGALTSLHLDCYGVPLLDAPAAALLGGALRTHRTFETLELSGADLWRDAGAAATLMSSLVAHPSLRAVIASENAVPPAHAACAGAALFALVAANAPALQRLHVSHWQLGDEGLAPLFDALPRNTHLRSLYCLDNE